MTETTPRRLLPVMLGIALTALFLLLLGYLAQKRSTEEAEVPTLTIIAPLLEVFVDSPLVVTFRSTQPLALRSMGWGSGLFHLHAWLNNDQVMPAAADIRARSDGAYDWTLPQAKRGPVEVWLGWADVAHKPVSAGASQTVSVTIR